MFDGEMLGESTSVGRCRLSALCTYVLGSCRVDLEIFQLDWMVLASWDMGYTLKSLTKCY